MHKTHIRYEIVKNMNLPRLIIIIIIIMIEFMNFLVAAIHLPRGSGVSFTPIFGGAYVGGGWWWVGSSGMCWGGDGCG